MSLSVRVLVVDDDPDSRARTTASLRRVDEFSVSAADSSSAALAHVDESSVDCIVTTHDPPTVDGFGLLDTLRADEYPVPVVFFPAEGSEALAGEALAAGADGYVPNTTDETADETLVERIRAVVTTDRTDRETRSAREFSYYRALVEEVMDGAHIIDSTGERVFFNGRSATVHDIAPERLRSEAPQVFVEEGIMEQSDLDSYNAVVQDLLDGKRETARVEMELDLPTVGPRIAETRLSRIEDDALDGVVATTRDVTERVQTEQQLETQNRRLSNLARFFSHDLRNPLNVAIGYAELAREGGDSEHFDRLDAALARMDRLVDDALLLTDRDATDLEQTSLSLSSVANRAWETVETGDATLVVETEGTVVANEGSLLRLFENVYRNAVAHGGSAVQVTVRATDDGFAIDDDGKGFPPETRRLLGVGVSGGDSTGLGLAIVSEIAETHEWTLALEVSPEGGARVRFGGVDVP